MTAATSFFLQCWPLHAVLGALTIYSLQVAMTIAEPTAGDIFLAYLESVLCRETRPSPVVVMDNLSALKMAGA